MGTTGLAVAVAALAAVALPGVAAAAPLPVTSATAGAIYDNIPSPVPGNLPSEAFEAQSASEFGGVVAFTGTARTNAVVTVLMSSWGCQSGHWYSDNCVTTPGSRFSEPITLNIYNPGAATEGSAPGSLVGTVTKTFEIPYRPSADNTDCNFVNTASNTGPPSGEWYDATLKTCFNGLATPVTFNLAGTGIVLPSQVVISVAYNTSDYGYNPYGDATACHSSSAGCGYDSLNVALTAPPSVGTDPRPDDAYVNSSWSGAYCDTHNPGIGHFVLDTGCWGGYQPAIEVQTPTTTVLHTNPSIARIIPGFTVYLTLSAQLTTSAGNPVVGEPVTFSAGGSAVCTAVTDASGNAACGGFSGAVLSVLSLGYRASFAGDGVLQATSAAGPLLVIAGVAL